MNTKTLKVLKKSIRVAPSIDEAKFVWAYAKRNAHPHSRAPVSCGAIFPDRVRNSESDETTLVGFAVGFSYCSQTDFPLKNRGRGLALGRAFEALKVKHGARTRYGQEKTSFDGNNEPFQTGHVLFVYIPAMEEEETNTMFNKMKELSHLPENEDLIRGIRKYIANACKHGKL